MSEKSSYGQILKSSSVMGGAAGVSMLISMIRIKFAAVLIGTNGVGLLASFTAIQGLVGAVAGLGIQSSAVREVAVAVGKGDEQGVGRAILTLRRISWLTGLVGLLGMILLAPTISQMTFGSDQYVYDIAALGLVILMANVSGGQMALIQGMRRIGDLAKVQMTGAALGAVAAIVFYFWLGLRGVVPSLIVIAGITLLISWYFAQRVHVPLVRLTWKETFFEASGMVKLGIVFMITGLLNVALSYVIMAVINRDFDVNAVGIYSAAYALSAGIMSLVISAMSSDYYPRLVGVVDDSSKAVRMVDEQLEIGVFLALPLLVGIYIFSPQVVLIFYSQNFIDSIGLIEIFIFGSFARVIAWPMGFVVLAAGKKLLFLMLESTLLGVQILLVVYLIPLVGLDAVAFSFTFVAVLNVVVEYFVARKLIGYKLSCSSAILLMIVVLFCGLMFGIVGWVDGVNMYLLGGVFFLYVSIFSLSNIVYRIQDGSKLSGLINRIPLLVALTRFGYVIK